MPNPERDMDKLQKIESGWEQNAPGEKFADMDAAQFKAEIDKSRQVRDEIADQEARLKELYRRRDDVDKANLELANFVVDGVRASRKHGRNSPLYASMGFVRNSERKAPTRKPKTDTDGGK